MGRKQRATPSPSRGSCRCEPSVRERRVRDQDLGSRLVIGDGVQVGLGGARLGDLAGGGLGDEGPRSGGCDHGGGRVGGFAVEDGLDDGRRVALGLEARGARHVVRAAPPGVQAVCSIRQSRRAREGQHRRKVGGRMQG